MGHAPWQKPKQTFSIAWRKLQPNQSDPTTYPTSCGPASTNSNSGTLSRVCASTATPRSGMPGHRNSGTNCEKPSTRCRHQWMRAPPASRARRRCCSVGTPAIDRIATLPKVMAIAEFSCGKAMRAGRFVGSIKHQFEGEGDGALGLHADQNWMPVPFPEHNLVMTFCFACEGMTHAGGATCVVPDSHRLRRPPSPEDVKAAEAVAIETEKGDVAVWDGAVWHGSLPRTIPGHPHGPACHLSASIHPADRRLHLPLEGRGVHGERS